MQSLLKPYYKYGLMMFSYKLSICYMVNNYVNNNKLQLIQKLIN